MNNARNLAVGLALLVAIAVSASATDLAVLRNGFSIPHERREVVNSMTRLYVAKDGSSYVDIPTAEIEHFEKDLTAVFSTSAPSSPPSVSSRNLSPNLNDVVNSISSQHHLDPDLVNSVIRAESGFNPHAVSPKGAQGLMQLMPKTASQLGVPNAFDPQSNVEGGARYLRELLERYNFDLVKALAAYNAGPQRVEQYRGVPPYYETRAYVARIVRDFNRKKTAEQNLAKTLAAPAAHVGGQHASRTRPPVPTKAASASTTLQSE